MQSLYDTMQPIKYKLDRNGYRVYEYERKYDRIKSKEYQTIQNPTSYLKTSPVELLGNMVGVSTQSSYKPRVSRSQMRRAMGKAKNIQTKTDKYRQRERSK